jgi:hypothetical protein
MIPKRSRQRVTPVLRFVEGGQLSLERDHYSVGVDDPEARWESSPAETRRSGGSGRS